MIFILFALFYSSISCVLQSIPYSDWLRQADLLVERHALTATDMLRSRSASNKSFLQYKTKSETRMLVNVMLGGLLSVSAKCKYSCC